MSNIASRPFWSLHTHSKFSFNDALPAIPDMVKRAVELDYPALGLTDHGNPSGSIQLYKACRKAGIEPLPGMELYVVPDTETAGRKDSMHLTINAYTEAGYRNLMHIATLSARKYWYKPQIDFADFAAMAADGATKGLVVSTGCYFGVIPTTIRAHGIPAAVKVAQTLAGWFPRVYVELQNHGIEQQRDADICDDEMIEAVWEVAQRAGLPCVVTRDSHYTNAAERPLHEALKRLVSFSDDVNEAVFPGGGYHMTNEDGLRKFFEPKYLLAGLEGLSDLANAAHLRLPELESFRLKIPDVSLKGDPQVELEHKVMGELSEAEKSNQEVIDQLRAELDVIRAGGYAPFILLADLVCQFMREKKIRYIIRGSATGSLVNYIMGITQLDPIGYKLKFSRFLSSNRIKPPDYDFDIEHTRRDEVVAFLTTHWSVRSIGSHRKYTLEGDEGDEESGKGSLRIRYFSTMKKNGGTKLAWGNIPEEDKSMLYRLADLSLLSGYGTHAAGYIVAPDEDSVSQLPLAYIASSKKLVTAYGKKDVEQLGFLKLDLLGSRTMTAVKVMEQLSGISFDDIPDDDPATMRAISSGRNVGIFQLEGYTMSKGCQRLKPKKTDDIITAQALFRPASMNSNATRDYLARKSGIDQAPLRHKDIMLATKDTFGTLLFQETVMDVMERLGMTPVQLESMLDAVKASNDYSVGAAVVIKENLPLIRKLAGARDWKDDDIAWLSEALVAYADYSFGKAHSASYGVTAYRCAYFRVHHPDYFWTGVAVAYADHKKINGYISEARRDKVRVLGPHVNYSLETYSYDIDRKAIRRGLLSVKGVGPVAAKELAKHAPYISLVDLGQRVLSSRVSGAMHLALKKKPADAGGIIAALEEADALAGLEMEAWTQMKL